MNIEMAIEVVRGVIIESLTLVGPFLAVAIFIGISISLLQTITSIQDATLTFVPKLIGLSALILLLANWILRSLMEFTILCMQRMSDLIK
ncbi:MAG: flagellar biosynthetic protein FliQ [Flavobacterium sp.]|nr:flagellar biosynthetic protein FliQ [Flavobacterium sp.]